MAYQSTLFLVNARVRHLVLIVFWLTKKVSYLAFNCFNHYMV